MESFGTHREILNEVEKTQAIYVAELTWIICCFTFGIQIPFISESINWTESSTANTKPIASR